MKIISKFLSILDEMPAIFIIIITVCCLMTTDCFSQGVAVNTTGAVADPSAIIDATSNSQGVLIPRLTTSERDNNIINPATGLQIFNTTTNCLEIFIPPMWQSVYCGCTPPVSPVAGVNSSSATEIIWDWNDVPGAIGYQWNTTNVYPGYGNNVILNSSLTQSGLVCNTYYEIYIWAYNSCGYSNEVFLSETTSACWSCGMDFIDARDGLIYTC